MSKLLNRKGVALLLAIIVFMITALPLGTENKALASACDGVTPGTTSACPIMIVDAAGLDAMRNHLDRHYALGADIDLSAYLSPGGPGYNGGDGWDPVGSGGGPTNAFRGTFNGNGHTISNLKINSSAGSVGLFGATLQADIRNVGLINVAVGGTGASSDVGSLVGNLNGSTLDSVYVTGTVEGVDNVGGLVGYALGVPSEPSRIRTSYVSVKVTGTPFSDVGALIGYSQGDDFNVIVSYYNSELGGSSAFGTGITTDEMKYAANFSSWDFSEHSQWGILDGIAFPMHRTTLNQIVLDELAIDDGDIAYEPAFAPHTLTYASRVTGGVNSVTVSVYSNSSRMNVSIGGEDTDSKVITLIPGNNSVNIAVSTDVAVPGAATNPFAANYTLQIVRENGTDYPHRITTAMQLAAIGTAPYELSDSYELMNDLDLTGLNWDPIGDGVQPFAGTFEGNRHVIRNLHVAGADDDAGLFAASSGTIQNIGLENASVSGGDRVGGLVGSNSGSISNAYVKGSVAGDEHVGGLVGLNSGAANAAFTYAAALVSGADHTGGLIGETAAGVVSASYWDNEISALLMSSGGEGKTTADMQLAATYSGWDFAGTWAMMNGTTYPMFIRHFDAVKLQALGATSTDGVLSWNPAVFASAQGAYDLLADRYIESVNITASPADSNTSVTISATGAPSAQVAVKPGNNVVPIETKGVNGMPDGAYRLTVKVPAPAMTGFDVPSAQYYGIGDSLTFTVSYEGDIDVAGVPALPVTIGEGADTTTVYAAYAGQPAGERNKLIFTYVVQEGLVHSTDIAVGTHIQLPGGAGINAAATTVAVPLALPAAATTGIMIDSVRPEIMLTQQPASTVTTNSPVTVTATLDGTGSDIAATKWAEGARAADYFATDGQLLSGGSFQAAANGTYSVYAIDEAGNEAVTQIAISNIRQPSNGSGSSGNSGVAPEPSTPSTGPALTIDSDGGITLRMDSSSIVKEKLEDGTIVEQASLTDEIIDQVRELLGKVRKPFVTVVIGDSGQAVQTQFSWSSLAKVKSAYPDAVFKVELNASSYELPVKVLNPGAQARHVNVFISKVVGQEKERLEQAASSAGHKLIGDAVDYRVTVSVDGKETEVREFGGTYRVRGIVLNEGIPAKRMTAVLYDPATRTFSFVPAVTATRADGKREIAIKVSHNSIYALLETGSRSFSDLDGHWAKGAVELLAAKLIVSGVSDTSFAPGDLITRAEFTALLVRALGLQVEPTSGSGHFVDVAKEDWFAPVVEAGVGAGLIKGLSKDKFAPGARITREQMAVMFGNALALVGHSAMDADRVATALDRFEDNAEVSAWARSAVAQSLAAGIVTGMTEDAITPSAAATRAQSAVMLRRFLQYVEFMD
ncbi:S-layer homology domain-containing protein [Cohnella sp. LGH]|uniref:S-layer homology domain-containing protein n=1 Tax=Cohnella sp. LGH TaxID=1619153 RepID=UPI001ADC2C0E|nr:S-layer homology domain-containing protein [Cohnella sp. LGH]QTH43706.1 S-layer homology domain-containing protein [Cohnella sp. LGH]